MRGAQAANRRSDSFCGFQEAPALRARVSTSSHSRVFRSATNQRFPSVPSFGEFDLPLTICFISNLSAINRIPGRPVLATGLQ
jgi:hypothetical protein